MSHIPRLFCSRDFELPPVKPEGRVLCAPGRREDTWSSLGSFCHLLGCLRSGQRVGCVGSDPNAASWLCGRARRREWGQLRSEPGAPHLSDSTQLHAVCRPHRPLSKGAGLFQRFHFLVASSISSNKFTFREKRKG